MKQSTYLGVKKSTTRNKLQ